MSTIKTTLLTSRPDIIHEIKKYTILLNKYHNLISNITAIYFKFQKFNPSPNQLLTKNMYFSYE